MKKIRHLIFLAGDQLNLKFLESCEFDPSVDHVVMNLLAQKKTAPVLTVTVL